ncbi:putative flippase GtrA [Paenibacillus shirakamiensis]|uniref:Flippase GtrA n=1 Tax=Paenibacillus shirakamiensis TaxID=1265935 RepID=A0ABS4JLC0_9BACL|nr:GtrA family protein [Paenibacillus shirakamiensis]MBP2002505.1 putative flippase GtrA [Paenibacillus shirakamiensis]
MNKRLAQLFKFGFVGALNTIIDLCIFTLLSWGGVGAILAQIISYSCGVLNSYALNNNWTFREQKEQHAGAKLARFIIINLVALAVSSLIIHLLYDRATWGLTASKLTATAASMIVNYIGSRFWVFRSIPKDRSESV